MDMPKGCLSLKDLDMDLAIWREYSRGYNAALILDQRRGTRVYPPESLRSWYTASRYRGSGEAPEDYHDFDDQTLAEMANRAAEIEAMRRPIDEQRQPSADVC